MIFSTPKQRRREQLMAQPFPDEWLPFLHDNVFLDRLLSEEDQEWLYGAVRIFIAEKFWEGCAGLQITEEMMVTVAANACLLLLGFDDYYFDELQSILLYPGGFLRTIEDPLGRDERFMHLLGEAHRKGPVVLSWWQTRWDGRRLGKTNLVIHEFAHKLAELGDPIAGIPPLEDGELAERWEEVVEPEYERLVKDAGYDRPTLLDHYGASNRAEFFAVATECFFLRARALKRRHPALYQLLADWYCQDPAAWKIDETVSSQAKSANEEYVRHIIGECTSALCYRPDYVEAYRRRAAFYSKIGDLKRALADSDAVIRLSDGDEKAVSYYERGLINFDAESFDAAITDFGEAIRRLPDFASAYRARGAAYAAKGERERALASLNRALSLDPEDDAAYRERAGVFYECRDYEKAIRDLTRAIQLAPSVAESYCDRARVHCAEEEYDQAIADCEKALRLDPELAEAYHHRGVAQFHMRNYKQAIADLREAIRFAPECAETIAAMTQVHQAMAEEERKRTDTDRYC
jgi:MtfA peptidase